MRRGRADWFRTDGLWPSLKDGLTMSSETSSVSPRRRSPPKRRDISSGSVPLTKSEIEALRRGKKRLIAFAQEAFAGMKRPDKGS